MEDQAALEAEFDKAELDEAMFDLWRHPLPLAKFQTSASLDRRHRHPGIGTARELSLLPALSSKRARFSPAVLPAGIR